MTSQASSALITHAEESARHSRRGYEYQDLIAASFCLQMLRDVTLEKVACETQDDVVLTWRIEKTQTINEFVQVKSDRLKQQWSIFLFCEQQADPQSKFRNENEKAPGRKNTSIFEKNALRDEGKRKARFRIITRSDVNELRTLTQARDDRSPTDIAELAERLEHKLGDNTTLTPNDIRYWTKQAIWDVRGTDGAVFNDNFRTLAEVIETQERRLLTVVELEGILYRLAEETRAMAIGKGRCGIDPNAVTADELRKWLAMEVAAIPNFLGADEIDALLREERHSVARCRALWLALGVSESDAEALAIQPEVGARADFFAMLPAGFHWVTAAYGAGKSLAVERLFQRHLADYMARRDTRVPIFLRAYGVTGALQDSVLARLRELHCDSVASRPFVILDAVDEAGLPRAQRFLQEASELSATWPGSTFIVTSADLPFTFEQFRRQLPELTDDQAADITTHFAQHEVDSWTVRDRLGEDFGLALMCVLLGLTLHETEDAFPSKGELLHRVVEAARKRSGSDASNWAEKADILSRIAMLSTDTGGGPVRLSDLKMASIEIASLASTRLVTEEAGNMVFTVATMRLWFAAQALRKELVNQTELVADLARVRHWQEPLAIFVATTDFDSASRYFGPLASTHPAVAAQVIADATRQWGEGGDRHPSEFAAFAERMAFCLKAWLKGIAPLDKICRFTDSEGELLKLRIGSRAPYTVITFSEDPSLPLTSALPLDWSTEGAMQYHLYHESGEPSHLWRKTQSMVESDLLEFVKGKRLEFFDAALFHEEVWNQAIGFAQTSRWFANSVPWNVIDRFESVFRSPQASEWLRKQRALHPLALPAPHPPADLQDAETSWISSFYSPQAALARAQSIYEMALFAYQRIVATWFPKFRYDLQHSAWWPYRILGRVGSTNGKGVNHGWWISYYCEPVETEVDTGVSLESGTDEGYAFRLDFESLRISAMKLRPCAPPWFWAKSAALNFHDSHPASTLVKNWLGSDLRSAGWRG